MSLTEFINTALSILALVVSIVTAWLTLFRKGRIHMTRPNIVGFAFDGLTPKIFLRFLLYSTAQRGNIIESMYVELIQSEKRKIYSFWGYGDSPDSLVRGSGLFVSLEGVAFNHHFILPKHENTPVLEVGTCTINVYCSVLGQKKDQLLYNIQFNIKENEVAAINNPRAGIFYDWNPDSKEYHAQLR